MKLYLLHIVVAIMLCGCVEKKIVKQEDFQWVLKPDYVNRAVGKRQEELEFWKNHLKRDTGSFVDMLEIGYNYLSLFKIKGHLEDLRAGEKWILRAAQKLNYTDPDILQTLSQVSITNHRFSEADAYITDAFKKGGSPYIHQLLSFDAGMELGKYHTALKELSRLKDKSSFDFLIRKAKYEDHVGNLDEAIRLMEQAFDKVKTTNRKELYCWTLSNLGDMYGHSGKVRKAYKAYVDVLHKEPSYLYALKGIAWICYAQDGNTKDAKQILHFILSQTQQPDLYLILAEIAEYEHNVQEKNKLNQQFISATSQAGDMYNKYLIELFASALNHPDRALALAEKEINNRPTPETFSWLAWAYYCKGNAVQANNIYHTYVSGRSFEPKTIFKSAIILAANGQDKKAKELLEWCLQSSFELGPLRSTQVKEKMAALNNKL